jgi:hypothetical protein
MKFSARIVKKQLGGQLNLPLPFPSLPFPPLPFLSPPSPLSPPLPCPLFFPLMASDSEPKNFFELQMLVGEF